MVEADSQKRMNHARWLDGRILAHFCQQEDDSSISVEDNVWGQRDALGLLCAQIFLSVGSVCHTCPFSRRDVYIHPHCTVSPAIYSG